MRRSARIALLGISVESNRFAPAATLQHFRDYAYLEGEEILSSDVIDYWLGNRGGRGFLPAMSRLRDWCPLPILIADGQAAGAVQHDDYERIKARMLERLRDAMPVDAVYVIAHGAGRTTRLDDLDGDYLRAVREVVGDAVPVVATLDLHANLTPEMISSCDALIAQRTNPHVDSQDRAEDAATQLHRMLTGWRPVQAASRLPLLTPQVSQLTDRDEPLGAIIAGAEAFLGRGACEGISVIPGFSFTDAQHNGFWLYAFGEQRRELREALETLSTQVWSQRQRFRRATLSVDEAVGLASTTRPDEGPRIFADIADNPGGGATGDTTWLLDAFLRAELDGGVFAPFIDVHVVQAANEVGVGGEFIARFNENKATRFSRPLSTPAKVLWLGDGDYESRYGVYAGSRVPLGPSCVLDIRGNSVIVISACQQLLGEDFISHFGVDVRAARFVVGKSRGHFRAGFAHLIKDERIHEVDSLGLTTARLDAVPWKHIARPIAPLDADLNYRPHVTVYERRSC
ncbi:MAG: M81 family metallopeptidase [Pseudomonadota bacterium]